MASYQEGTITLTASEAVKAHIRVKQNSSAARKVDIAGAGEEGIGFAIGAAVQDESVGIKLYNAPGTRLVVAAKALDAGATVYGAAAGKVSDVSSGEPLGVLLQAASGDNSIVEMLPTFASHSGISDTLAALTDVTATDTQHHILVRNDAGAMVEVSPDTLRVTELLDSNGNEAVEFAATASAINQIKLVNSAENDEVEVQAVGDDTNIDLKLVPKGTGEVIVGGGKLAAANGETAVEVADVASAVNHVKIVPGATGDAVELQAAGETDVNLKLVPKGAGLLELPTEAGDVHKDISSGLAADRHIVIDVGGTPYQIPLYEDDSE